MDENLELWLGIIGIIVLAAVGFLSVVLIFLWS